MRKLTVLSVAYPFTKLSRDTSGGAEQVLAALDHAIVAAGHRSFVVAREGSRTAGTLASVRVPPGELDVSVVENVHGEVRATVARVLSEERIDVIHLHGIDFDRYLPAPGLPTIVTLHLPPSWYPRAALRPARPDTLLCCVSEAQRRALPPWVLGAEVVDNGVFVDLLRYRLRKCEYCLVLARICPEKGITDAIDAANRARVPLVIAGEISTWPAHRAYFEDCVEPRLGPSHRYLGAIGFERKRRLLAGARAVLIPSRAPETSSLVAMEALASGTPVIAFGVGALPHIVEHGVTGFIVDDANAMARAIERSHEIDPRACRRVAEERFGVERMTARYLELYERLASRSTARIAPALDIGAARGVAALEALADEWRSLSHSAGATPFQSPEWLLAYARTFCDTSSNAEPWALVARRGAELVGVAPLCTRQRKTSLLGDGVSDYLDFVIAPDLAGSVVQHLLDTLVEACQGHEIVLDELRQDSMILSSNLANTHFERGPCPFLRLAGGIEPLPRSMRDKIRYYRNRAERLGRVEFDDVTGRAATDALKLLFDLHRARWISRGELGALTSEQVEAFLRDAIPSLARRRAAIIHVLRIGGKPAGAALVLRDAWSAYYYMGGFDPAFASASPGTLTVSRAIASAQRDQLAEFDFLRGGEAYKYRFGAINRFNVGRRFSSGIVAA